MPSPYSLPTSRGRVGDYPMLIAFWSARTCAGNAKCQNTEFRNVLQEFVIFFCLVIECFLLLRMRNSQRYAHSTISLASRCFGRKVCNAQAIALWAFYTPCVGFRCGDDFCSVYAESNSFYSINDYTDYALGVSSSCPPACVFLTPCGTSAGLPFLHSPVGGYLSELLTKTER